MYMRILHLHRNTSGICLRNIFHDYHLSFPPKLLKCILTFHILHIQKGEFVFIVGKSGSGKSTLIKLLLKELDPTSGKIYVNKKYLNKITRKNLHDFIRISRIKVTCRLIT